MAGVRDAFVHHQRRLHEEVARLRSIGPGDPGFEHAAAELSDLEESLAESEDPKRCEAEIRELLLAYRRRHAGDAR